MPFLRLIIVSLFLVQLSFSDDPNWRVLRVIEQTEPFKPLNSIYRKQAVKDFWLEHSKVMEDITQNWQFLRKSSKSRKWKTYLSHNPSFNNYIKIFVTDWMRNLISKNKYVQNELSKVDTLAYQKLVQQNSQSERLEEILSWEEKHKDAFQLIKEFEKEAFTSGTLLPSVEKKSVVKKSEKTSSEQIKSISKRRKNDPKLKLKMNQLEKKIRLEKMKSVKDRVRAEINRQAKEFMQSEAMKNGFRGPTAAKNRAFVEQSVRETTLRWLGQDIEKKVRAEIETEIQAEVEKQIKEY